MNRLLKGNRLICQFTKQIIYIFFAGLLFICNPAKSQEEKSRTSKTVANISLNYKKKDGVISVNVSVFKKAGNKRAAVTGNITNLYLNEETTHNHKTGDGWLGTLPLDFDGKASYELTSGAGNLGSGKHEFKFIIKMKGDKNYADKEEEIIIKDASITISISTKDTLKMVTAKLTEWKEDGTEAPVAGAELKLSIKRTFSLFPFGGDLTTDKNGEVTASLPNDVIGEANGTLIVVARIEENESFGTVQVSKAIPWNILPKVKIENKRNLWSTGKNAPYSLVLASVSIIFLTWGIIAYLVTRLFKIYKIGNK